MSRYAYNLKPFGSSQKDFYGKAIVVVTNDKYENTHRLYSYDTQVACLDYNNSRVEIFGWFSNTTSRHIKSFKAFCDMNPTISTDGTFTIKAFGKPTVNLSNVSS